MEKLTNIKFLAKGKRSLVFTAKYKNKLVAIKVKKKSSQAINRLENEAKFLKMLNKHNIGPKLIKQGKDYIIYEFVKGKPILKYKKSLKNIILNVLDQCFILDKLKINKLEMHHPVKHILIDKSPVLIDFERCYYTKNPKNVTQFCQFLMNTNKKLNKKLLIKTLKKYKFAQNKENFNSIKKILNSA